jgi:hypothetical protein
MIVRKHIHPLLQDACMDLYIGHVWTEVLVLVCSKLIPKLTFWSQTHVLAWC